MCRRGRRFAKQNLLLPSPDRNEKKWTVANMVSAPGKGDIFTLSLIHKVNSLVFSNYQESFSPLHYVHCALEKDPNKQKKPKPKPSNNPLFRRQHQWQSTCGTERKKHPILSLLFIMLVNLIKYEIRSPVPFILPIKMSYNNNYLKNS